MYSVRLLQVSFHDHGRTRNQRAGVILQFVFDRAYAH